jgi:hypothetical protein
MGESWLQVVFVVVLVEVGLDGVDEDVLQGHLGLVNMSGSKLEWTDGLNNGKRGTVQLW